MSIASLKQYVDELTVPVPRFAAGQVRQELPRPAYFGAYPSNVGPWAHVRHPIYLASLLSNLGVAMIIGTALLVLQFVAYTLFETLFASCYEERGVRKIFPREYEEYSKRVPRWIPRIRG